MYHTIYGDFMCCNTTCSGNFIRTHQFNSPSLPTEVKINGTILQQMIYGVAAKQGISSPGAVSLKITDSPPQIACAVQAKTILLNRHIAARYMSERSPGENAYTKFLDQCPNSPQEISTYFKQLPAHTIENIRKQSLLYAEKLSDNEIEAALFHEVGHVACDHSRNSLPMQAYQWLFSGNGILMSAALTCASIILGKMMASSRDTFNPLSSMFKLACITSLATLPVIGKTMWLQNCQRMEYEADKIGYINNKEGLIRLLKRKLIGELCQEPAQSSTQGMLEQFWISTHPSHTNRLAKILQDLSSSLVI